MKMNDADKSIGKRFNIIIATICTFFIVILMILIAPMDAFYHGYYCDVVDYNQIATEDRLDYVELQKGAFEMKFSPLKRNLRGFEINLINQPEGNTGTLLLQIFDDKDQQLDEIEVDLGEVHATMWYKVYLNRTLKKGEIYTLRISTGECDTVPFLQIVDPDYLTDENVSGDLLIGYAYARPTFSVQERILILLFMVAVCGFIWACVLKGSSGKILKYAALFLLLTVILSWNYMYDSMDKNTSSSFFAYFQKDSEKLVSDMIISERNGIWFKQEELGYGLGTYYGVEGYLGQDGYMMDDFAVQVKNNPYIDKVASGAKYVGFENGDIIQITEIQDREDGKVIKLNTTDILTEVKYGEISNIVFYNAKMEQLPVGELDAYRSQYGLQGRVFRHLARHMDYVETIKNCNLICSMMTAMVFVVIVFLIRIKYNKIFAGCFLITFWLSPWIVSFARNLYWVEFTWFFPMAVGLFCAWKIEHRGCRIGSYVLVFISIMLKCLCGYEYISSVMLGMIVFLVADFSVAFANGDKKGAKLIFKTTFIIGTVAVLGFVAAICIHAPLRGDGSVVGGIRNIFEQDVLRRTSGVDMNKFSEILWPSFNASVWEVVCQYFNFPTEIITGIGANLFPLLCIVPIVMLIYLGGIKRLDIELLSLYVVSFLMPVSWFCLAKSHSYIHTHMNYVLWYMGYVQICLYIVINGILSGIKQHFLGKEN